MTLGKLMNDRLLDALENEEVDWSKAVIVKYGNTNFNITDFKMIDGSPTIVVEII
jgi:hypothetical protein